MARGGWRGVLISVAVLAAACSGGDSEDATPLLDDSAVLASALLYGDVTDRVVDQQGEGALVSSVVESINEFAFDLHRELAAAEGGNLVSSPYSIASALGMVYAGAAGETEQELAAALHISDDVGQRWHEGRNLLDLTLIDRTRDTDTDWLSANRVWFADGLSIEASFLDVLTGHYGAPAMQHRFDDDGREMINEWVDEQTNGRVGELFGPGSLTADTQMVLVNAVTLDAPWELKFDPEATTAGPFRGLDGLQRQVPLMRYGKYLPSAVTNELEVVELPYAGGELSMIVMVPSNFSEFEASLDAARFDEILGSIRRNGIHLSMPRWTATTDVDLREHLAALGVEHAFSDADFSPIFGESGPWLDDVLHEATIEVDENGTRAAAATGAEFLGSHGPTINVDRPFVYAVVDRGPGTILFLGRMVDPTELVG